MRQLLEYKVLPWPLSSKLNRLRTDSRVLRADYCILAIPHNTAIWFRFCDAPVFLQLFI